MLDKFNSLYTKIKKQLVMEQVEQAGQAEKGANHEKQLTDKIQAWFPDENLDELLDLLSEPEAGGLPAEAYKKMDKLIEGGADESDAFYEVYDGWDEDALKSYLTDHIG